jgi:transcription initiation factor TFIID subunit TAF12
MALTHELKLNTPLGLDGYWHPFCRYEEEANQQHQKKKKLEMATVKEVHDSRSADQTKKTTPATQTQTNTVPAHARANTNAQQLSATNAAPIAERCDSLH